ncbi:MAG: UDP-2,3-diacylglucosamine diphosphatase LpxI [Pseudomonadota bacterium]
MARWTKIGIIAGGGNLPLRLAQSCDQQQAQYFTIRLAGMADATLEGLPGETVPITEAGRIFSVLHDQKCDAVVLAGNVQRPNFLTLKPDWRGAALLPKLAKAALKGDGAILATLVDAFEAEGFAVVGADELLASEVASRGALTAVAPVAADFLDIAKARRVIAALGQFDVGQGAVVCGGQVWAIEAAEGTDAMLARCADVRASLDLPVGMGVLVKMPKPGQELRVDLPTIGPETIRRAKAAGLAGVAVEARGAIIIDKAETIQCAEGEALFIYGVCADDPNLPPAGTGS